MNFNQRLITELVQLDQRESKKKGYNPYALAQYLTAAEGVTDAKSFSEAFNATRGMHHVAKNLGLALDVDRGQWILKES